jgi:DNA-binding transcriptional LysR family regulator
MRLTLDALLVVDAIDRRGSFAAAAQELHRVPSAITYTVQKLEQDIGVPLFDRSAHRAKLTLAGRELLQDGRHLLRAAGELESRVKRVATGWETELAISYDGTLPVAALLTLVDEFCQEECGTRLRLSSEVLGGNWDALMSGRADLAIGAPGDGPAGGGYSTHRLGQMEWVFAVAPDHPLAQEPEPIASSTVQAHRAITVADSSRNAPPRTSGLLSGQETLTVPDMAAKTLAQVNGLGVGNLPRYIAEREAAAKRLVIKETEEPKVTAPLYLAWRTRHKGNALKWLVQRLRRDPEWLAHALRGA